MRAIPFRVARIALMDCLAVSLSDKANRYNIIRRLVPSIGTNIQTHATHTYLITLFQFG